MEYGISGKKSLTCNPGNNNESNSTTVKCTIVANNNLSATTSFTVKRSKPISDAKPGDYIDYDPISRKYVSPKGWNGYSDQTFDTSAYKGLWRVLYNDSEHGFQITSNESVGWLTIYGLTGYNNIVETLNGISNAYLDDKYSISARHIGTDPSNPSDNSNQNKVNIHGINVTSWGNREGYKSDMTAMLNATNQNSKNILDYDPSLNLDPTKTTSEYLLVTRQKYTLTDDENNPICFCIIDSRARGVVSSDIRNSDRCPIVINDKGEMGESQFKSGVRPVIKLDLQTPVRGSGTKSDPLVIQY